MQIRKIDIHTAEDLEVIKKDWIRLEAGKDMTIYQSYAWNRLLVESWSKDVKNRIFSRISIYCLYDGNDIRFLMPLLIEKLSIRNRWMRKERGIHILGDETYTDYLNGIYDQCSQDDILQTLEAIRNDQKNMPMLFRSIKKETLFSSVLGKIGRLENTGIYVSVKRRSNAEAYRESLSKNTRQNLRTAQNRMEKDGVVYELKVLDRVEPDFIKKLQRMHTERLRIKNHNDRDLLHRLSSLIHQHFRIMDARLVFDSMKCIDDSVWVVIYLNGQIAGYLYGLKDRKSIHIMLNCVNIKYKYYSPMFFGAYDYIVKTYEGTETDEVDFTRGTETYKYRLGGSEAKLQSYSL